MDLRDLEFLLSEEGQRQLEEAAAVPWTARRPFQISRALGRFLEPAQVRAILATLELRRRAASKFTRAAQMFFLREALEQSSSEPVARHRARRLVERGVRRVADLGCGIGGDALALAEHMDVLGMDRDPVRGRMAVENVRVYGHAARFHFETGDLSEDRDLDVEALYFDPSRRDEHGRRSRQLSRLSPTLEVIERWRRRVPNMVVKLAPGVAVEDLAETGELEFVSREGELKEAVWWLGEGLTSARRRATLLPGGATLASSLPTVGFPIGPLQAYLLEPDPAVLRAGLIGLLAEEVGATGLDPHLAYLTTEAPALTPFARCYALEAHFPFQLKRLRRYLREQDVGQVDVKRRGSALVPEQIERRLRLRGSRRRTLFLTRIEGRPHALIGQPLDRPSASQESGV